MTAPQGPTTLTTSAIVDGQGIDAADVLVPLNEAAAAIDEARTTIAVSDNDGMTGYLSDKLTAGEGITLTVVDDGGDETLEITNILAAVPTGTILPYVGAVAPTGYLMMYGQEVSATTYLALLQTLLANSSFTLTLNAGTAFTAANATNLFTSAGHGLANGTVVLVSNSGGALPTGLSAYTPYYVINRTTNDFQLSTTPGGSAVDITTDGTGTHKFHTHFCLPDGRGRSLLGVDSQGGSSANRVTASAADSVGGSGGAESVTLTANNLPALTQRVGQSTGTGTMAYHGTGTTTTTEANINYGSPNTPISVMGPWLAINWIIRY